MAKGGNFERAICVDLSRWISDGESDDVFWRTAGSGARSTTRRKKSESTKNSAGDIGLLDPDHELGKRFLDTFLVELKVGYSTRTIKKAEIIKIIRDLAPEKAAQKISQIVTQARSEDKASVLSIIDSNKKDIILDWAEKARIEAADCGRKWFVIILKRDRRKRVAITNCFEYPYEGERTIIYVDDKNFLSMLELESFLHIVRRENMF